LYDAVRKIEIKEERGAVKEKHFFSLSLSSSSLCRSKQTQKPTRRRRRRRKKKKKPRTMSNYS